MTTMRFYDAVGVVDFARDAARVTGYIVGDFGEVVEEMPGHAEARTVRAGLVVDWSTSERSRVARARIDAGEAPEDCDYQWGAILPNPAISEGLLRLEVAYRQADWGFTVVAPLLMSRPFLDLAAEDEAFALLRHEDAELVRAGKPPQLEREFLLSVPVDDALDFIARADQVRTADLN